MKNIIIKKLSIVNFKGIRSLDIDFVGMETRISGANGTGKTTIFDAFTWLLFGKDSRNRTQFNIKTLDERGEPIPQIPHEVSAELEVDGKRVTLRRCWNEVWTNRRGSDQAQFSHNEGERFYNDVPCTDKEFKEKIDALCSEDRFRELTNPFYFTSQSKDYQRNALIAMAGDVSIEDIVESDPKQFGLLLDELSGKTLEEFEREVAFHKKRVKNEIADLEPRIDEKKRDLASLSVEDWESLEAALKERRERVADIDAQILDQSKAYEAASAERSEVARELAQLRRKWDSRQLELKEVLLVDYRKAMTEYQEACRKIDDFNADIASTRRTLESRIRSNRLLIDEHQAERERLMRKRELLLSEYRNLMASEFDENEAVCPTCHRPYETIERNLLEQEFIENRNAAIERNKEHGKQTKAKIEELAQAVIELEKENELTQANIDSLQPRSKDSLTEPTYSDIEVFNKLSEDSLSHDIEKQMRECKERLAQEVRPSDTADLTRQKQAINDEIIQLNSRLSVRAQIARASERLEELENALTENRRELEADNQREVLVFNFKMSRMNLLESRINAMFQEVRWRMYNKLNNGDLVETCECMIDGVPFSDLNSAARINAGLDIINAICRKYDMCAPIFIDNRESVTRIVHTESQVINLIVDADATSLDIK